MGSQGSHIQSHHKGDRDRERERERERERGDRDSATSPSHSPRSSFTTSPRSSGDRTGSFSFGFGSDRGSGVSSTATSPRTSFSSPTTSPRTSFTSSTSSSSSSSTHLTAPSSPSSPSGAASPLTSALSPSTSPPYVVEGVSREVEVFELAVAGNVDRLEKFLKEAKKEGLLKCVMEYRHPPAEHRTPLHAASRFGKPNCVAILIKYGADLWALSSTGSTPLHDAAWMGHLECARLLVSHSFSTPELRQRDYVNTPGEGHKSPLRLAAYNGHVEVGLFLIMNGAKMAMKDDRKSTALAAAAFSRSARTPGHPAFVRMLCTMAKESDTDMNDFLNNRDDEDSTPVHIAALRNHTEVLRVLIEYGADITVVSKSLPGAGNTPLHLACREESVESATLLLEKGAEPNIRNDYGQTPLDLAILPMSYWNPSLIRVLLDKGGRLGILDHQYRLLPYPSPTSPLFNSTSSPPTSPPTPPHRSSYASPPSTQDKFQRAFDLGVTKKQWKEALEIFEDILRSSTKSELSYCLHWNIGQCAIQCWKQEIGSGGTKTGSLVRRTSRESATGTAGLGSEGRASGERRGSEGSRSEGRASGERRGSEGSRSEGRGSRGRQGRASGGRGSEGAGEWIRKADEQFTNCLSLLKNKIGSEKVASKSVRLLEVMEKKLQLQFMKGKEDSEETFRLKVQILDLVTKYAPYLKGFNDILLEIIPLPASMHKKHGSKEGQEGEGEGGDVEGVEPLEIMEVYAFERFLQTRDQQKNDELALVYKYVFKAVNCAGEIVGQVNLEQSKISYPNYLLGMNDTSGQHSTLRRVVSGDATYQDVRHAISEALQGRVQPATSSHRGKY